MAGEGIKIGAAYYELSLDAANLVAGMEKARQASVRSAQQIAQATGLSEKAVTRYAQTAIRDHQRAAAAAEQAATRTAQAQARLAAGTAGVLKGVGSLVGGYVGLTAAASLFEKGLGKVVESTRAAEQSAFSLSKTYLASSGGMTQFANEFATATNRSQVAVQQAAVKVAGLTREYGLSVAQVQSLIRISSDLAAVYGKDLPDAAGRLEAAIRGEAESAEILGLSLSDGVVATRQLGQENKELFEKLTDSEKAQLRLAEATRQLGDRQGAANERTQTALGAFDRLDAATTDLGANLGQRLLPVVAQIANVLSTMAEASLAALNAMNDLSRLDAGALANIASGLLNPAGVVATIAAGQNPFFPSATDPQGPALGPTPNEVAQAQNAAAVDAIKAKAQRRADLEAQAEAAEKKAEAEIATIEKERDAKERWYDEERTRIEARKHYQLEDIEARKDAVLASLEAEKQAAADRFDDLIKQTEREKQLRLDVAEAAHDAAEGAIADQARLNAATRQGEDRSIGDARRSEDRARADAIEAEDTARETAHRDELRRLEARHDAVMAGLEAEAAAVKKDTERRLRAIDQQADAARRVSDRAIRNIESQADREDERHRKAMRALDDELDARKQALDVQLDALDAAERAEDAARRTSDLQKRVTDAQGAVTRATGTGTPEEIAQAREELVRAYRVGNETSIANATERLRQLAGAGVEAVKEASEDLAEAQEALRLEGVDQTRDTERAKIEAAKAAIDEEGQARMRAEDDRSRERKRALDADKQAEQDRLKARLETLEKKKRAEQDSSAKEVEAIRARTDQERASYELATQSAKDAFTEQSRVIDQRREIEDRAIDDRRVVEDRDRADRRAAEDEALRLHKAAVDAALEQERRDAEEHYNGPNGVITQAKAASAASEREYSRRLAAARAAFEEERKQAALIYTNPEKTGLLDLLASAREAEFNSLEASKKTWQQWSKDVQQAVKDAMRGLSSPAGDAPAGALAASGQNTSTSTETTRSNKSGQKVQGDVVSWLNDAMDITGVGNNWLAGLQKLVKLESGGDPHNVNPEDVIDSRGVNLGKAKGLLQMLTPTFQSHRDRSLPDDVFDPVANAVAAIRYIQAEYGHVNHIPGLNDGGKFKGYAAGGWIDEPIIGRGLRSGTRYAFGERERELVVPGSMLQATAAGIDRSPLVGPMPTRNYAAVGASLSGFAAGGGNSSSIHEGDVNFYGLTYEEAEVRQRRKQHRDKLLRGVAALGRRR
jgi:hypothetical protein